MIYSKSVYSISEFLQQKGYELKKVFCDVYSISSSKIVELAAAVGCANSDVTNELMLEDICFGIVENEEEIKKRLVIHSQSIPYPTNNSIIYQNAMEIWEKCGKCIELEYSFHPKLLLACFCKKGENKWFYRLQISTGNMTSSKNVDVAIIVEGDDVCDEQQCNGSVLYNFYNKIYTSLSSEETGFPQELENLKTVSFSASQIEKNITEKNKRVQIEDVCFAYSYPEDPKDNGSELIKNRVLKEIKDQDQDVMVYSPFITFDSSGKTYLDEIDNMNERKMSVVYHTNLTQELCDKWKCIANKVKYSTKDYPFFHAKIYMWNANNSGSDKNCFRVWLGSANATQNGWENNVEFCVGFTFTILNQDLNQYYSDLSKWGYKADSSHDPQKLIIFKNGEPEKDKVHDSQLEVLLVQLLQKKISISSERIDDNYVQMIIDFTVPSFNERYSFKEIEIQFLDFVGDVISSMKIEETSMLKSIQEKITIDISKYPFKGYMVCRANIDGKIVNFTKKCDEKDCDFDDKKAESMLLLLNPFLAIQCIPRCAEQSFSNPNDDIYERLSAFICSYNGKKECYKMIKKRIDKIEQEIEENPNLYFLSKREDERKKRLKAICDGLEEK